MDIDLKEDNQITIEKNKDVISPKIKNEILSSSNAEKIKKKIQKYEENGDIVGRQDGWLYGLLNGYAELIFYVGDSNSDIVVPG